MNHYQKLKRESDPIWVIFRSIILTVKYEELQVSLQNINLHLEIILILKLLRKFKV